MRRLLLGALLALSLLVPALPADAASNVFPTSQCTYWAAYERPDLIGAVWGNAWQWVSEARWSGLPTGYRPEVGAVAVWQPWTAGADGYGHVAYVVQVGDNGWFQVSQRNWPIGSGVTYMWARTGYGISFIYRRNS